MIRGDMGTIRRISVGVAAAALLAGTAACGSEETDDRSQGSGGENTSARAAFEALSAAAESTENVTSADFEGVTRSPDTMGGEVEITGSMSWESTLVMEMSMTGEQFTADPSVPSVIDVVWLDGVMYMDMGEEFAAETGGRNWMRMDLMAIAEASGDQDTADTLSYGLSESNQDPAQQVALLLQSPEIEHVGQETLDGATVDHYQGTISVEDALNANSDALTDEERETIVGFMESQGIDSYDIEVWLDENDFPIQIHQSYETALGPVESEMRYSNLGTEVSVTEPPADAVVDWLDLLEQLE
jgi:hypothetical protein